MKRTVVMYAAVLSLAVAMSGCSSAENPRLVDWYGSYAVDAEMQLKVTTLGMSQIQYELLHKPSNRVIVSSTGSSFEGWFFFWDETGRLWGYWNDVGTVVWIPDRGGQFQRHVVYPGSPLLKEVPAELAANMPDWAKRSLGI